SYIFGPVPSRRLGRSLGIDLVPFKTCSYDCIYCQLGRTTDKTVERREWVPLEAILTELKEKLSTKPDYITLGGSGEPTLYSRLDELIAGIHAMTDIPVAVLTNGSLLWKKELRSQLLDAQLIIPSLDAGDAAMFEAVNRPHSDISFERMVEGLKLLKTEFKGEYWLEVFIAGGYTDSTTEVQKIANYTAEIKPDRVQLNTVTRPPAEVYAHEVIFDKLTEFAKLFNPVAEVIADFHGVHAAPEFGAARENVLQMLQRRPCTIDDIAGGLGIHRNEAIKHVEKLIGDKVIERFDLSGKHFYRTPEK
ncbi:MAG: radical SAM protein, partial [Victivallaceae bacterium]|nr:radical SAM protein [Victivallaceae bacterium]